MIHICICDDSDAMRDELCGLIQGLCQKHSIAASVSCCSSGEELLFDPDDKNRTTDIFFLDILMKKLNGIETAAKLRAINPTAQIIFPPPYPAAPPARSCSSIQTIKTGPLTSFFWTS